MARAVQFTVEANSVTLWRRALGTLAECKPRLYNALEQSRIASKDAKWGSCPIVGNQRPRVLTNGHHNRLFTRNPQKGWRPERAGFAALILNKD
jgi:hypothetical protein